MRALPVLPRVSPSLVTSSSPAAPPPATTMWCNPLLEVAEKVIPSPVSPDPEPSIVPNPSLTIHLLCCNIACGEYWSLDHAARAVNCSLASLA